MRCGGFRLLATRNGSRANGGRSAPHSPARSRVYVAAVGRCCICRYLLPLLGEGAARLDPVPTPVQTQGDAREPHRPNAVLVENALTQCDIRRKTRCRSAFFGRARIPCAAPAARLRLPSWGRAGISPGLLSGGPGLGCRMGGNRPLSPRHAPGRNPSCGSWPSILCLAYSPRYASLSFDLL